MIVLINVFKIMMMSAKISTSGILKIKIPWKKAYDVIIFSHNFTNKILSPDSNYNVNVVIGPNFGNSSFSVREVIIISILKGCDQKNSSFCEVVMVQVQ